ncbi:MAG TPA: sigma-70 family RNA polymerase sigma factor [Bacteroides sp.]|nr:sigma-70 family RNA polymerase sigma factor [Bacteroides sp.]
MSEQRKTSDQRKKKVNEPFLWESFKKGQSWAFKRIYMDYYDALFNYGSRMLHSESEAKDLIQDLFIRLWTRRRSLPGIRNLKGYLFTALRSVIIDYFRAGSRQVVDSDFLSGHTNFNISAEQEIIDRETTKETETFLLQSLDSLSNREKEAIYLRYYQNLDHKEIGRIMGLRYQSVRNLIHKALRSLREKM